MEDFKRVLRQSHRKGLAVIAFDNLGYCAIDAPHFVKACDDIRNGIDSKESKWFWWSKTNDAPPPQQPDEYYLGGSQRWENGFGARGHNTFIGRSGLVWIQPAKPAIFRSITGQKSGKRRVRASSTFG